MKPSIGRIVLFKSKENEVSPAIITKVQSDTIVNLTVFADGQTPKCFPTIPFAEDLVAYSRVASWYWPPRVD